MRPTILSLFLLGLAGSTAQAAVHAGNPVLELKLVVPGETVQSATVDVEDLVLVACDDSVTTIAIDDEVDLATGMQQAIPAGDWCDVELTGLDWDDAVGSNSSGSWSLELSYQQVSIDIDPGDGTLDLDQFTMVQGAIHAGNPVLEVFID